MAGGAQTKQTLLALGDYDRGFNFFLTGDGANNTNNLLGLDLYNGQAATGHTSDDDIKCQLFNKQGAAQYWTSGDWNHIALARINNNFQAYVNGYSAGKLNVFNTYFSSGQTDNEGDNIGLTQVITGLDENGIELFATGGAIDEQCVNNTHFGVIETTGTEGFIRNYYVTGIYSGASQNSLNISSKYITGLDVSGLLDRDWETSK